MRGLIESTCCVKRIGRVEGLTGEGRGVGRAVRQHGRGDGISIWKSAEPAVEECFILERFEKVAWKGIRQHELDPYHALLVIAP